MARHQPPVAPCCLVRYLDRYISPSGVLSRPLVMRGAAKIGDAVARSASMSSAKRED